MKERILIFHLEDRQKRMKVERALLPLKIRISRVEKSEYNQPLGVLAGVPEMEWIEGIYEGGELPDTMFVFAGLSDARLNQVLAALRKSGAGPFPYKAVLTETNCCWSAPECFEEIRKEHEAMTI